MPIVETDARKVIARLNGDGWTNIGGGKHDKFVNAAKPDVLIVVPRHRVLSLGVARTIAKLAGWI
jgi:predicted RNA binding protein YcfA (HicA-like mRNA interferase family)